MYCMEIFGNTYKYNLKEIVLLQERAIGIISGANRLAHTNNLQKIFKICLHKILMLSTRQGRKLILKQNMYESL